MGHESWKENEVISNDMWLINIHGFDSSVEVNEVNLSLYCGGVLGALDLILSPVISGEVWQINISPTLYCICWVAVLGMSKKLKSAIAAFVFEQLDLIFLCVPLIHARLVRQVKLRIQAVINILILTELLILSLTPLHSHSPISQKQNGGAAQRVRNLVYNEGFHLRKYPSKFSVCFNGLSSGINCH